MRKRILWVSVVGAAAVLITGGMLASNMGFKLNEGLNGPQANGALPSGFSTGTQLVALPFNQQTNLLDADDLLNDIDTCPGAANLVSRFVRSADAVSFYSCAIGGDNFTLTKGDAYFVEANTDHNYIIVGSHDPGLSINLSGPQANGALPSGFSSGTNPFAFPYHATPTNADELLNEISACPGTINLVSRFVRSADAVSFYSCAIGGGNFPLTPGTGYLVEANTDETYVPSHY